MKKIITLIVVALIICIGACIKGNNAIPNSALSGKWRLTDNLISSGGPPYWIKAPDDNGYAQFNPSGAVTGNVFADYKTYTLKDSVTLTLTKADNTTFENFYYAIRHDTLIMSPRGPIYCIEGCASRFVKVK